MELRERCVRLPSTRDGLASLAEAVDRFAEEAALPFRAAHDLSLVVEELVTNIIDHGLAPGLPSWITVEMRGSESGVQVTIRDHGRPFDPLSHAPSSSGVDQPRQLEQMPLGGLGIALVRRLTRGGSYRRVAGCNVLTLDLRRPLL